MTYDDVLHIVIENGITGAKKDYAKSNDKLEGAIAGFEACRGKHPEELKEVYLTAVEYVENAYKERATNYWWFRCYQAEVEWVCNVVSAALHQMGRPAILSHLPTIRGLQGLAAVVGVEGYNSFDEYLKNKK